MPISHISSLIYTDTASSVSIHWSINHVSSNLTMPTIQEDPPTAANPVATSDGSAPAPLVVNTTKIVNTAVDNSTKVHLGTICNATTTAETAQPSSINLDSTSTDGGEASASTQLTQLSKEAKKAKAERKRKQHQEIGRDEKASFGIDSVR
jgi:hypothetical protein